jgi:hypothetical protein
MAPGLGRRKWFWYLRTGPGGMPLALRLSEGLGITAVLCETGLTSGTVLPTLNLLPRALFSCSS